MCVSSRTAQAEEPSEQGEGGDDEDQAWFVCRFHVCSDFASKAARQDVEEQAASVQTKDLVEDAKKASERAVGVCFCSCLRYVPPCAGIAGEGRKDPGDTCREGTAGSELGLSLLVGLQPKEVSQTSICASC